MERGRQYCCTVDRVRCARYATPVLSALDTGKMQQALKSSVSGKVAAKAEAPRAVFRAAAGRVSRSARLTVTNAVVGVGEFLTFVFQIELDLLQSKKVS